jgi:hypothetical protein
MALDGKLVRFPASVLVSIRFGYESGSDRLMNFLSKLKKNRFGTHGGLAALDSIGFISSTRQTFPEWVSAYNVHAQIEGIDFALKYEAITFLWGEEGKCRIRLGQPLFAMPGAASVRVRIKTLANEKYTLSNAAASFAVDLTSMEQDDLSANLSPFIDLSLPVSIQSGYIYRIQAQVLDENGKVLSQTRIPPFQVKHVRGYVRIPFDTAFTPPKKRSRKHWARATVLLSD